MRLSLPQTIDDDRRLWQAFRYHSRTFSAAARLLPRPVRQPVATLYLFCRTVDTLADERVLEIGPERARVALDALRQNLDATLAGRPPDGFLWQRLGRIHAHYTLYPQALYELLDGAAWDLDGRPVETRKDLIDYSNLVGGSVGAMMLPFLLDRRADFARAEAPARALGIAMQITNIMRDVGEDQRTLGRVYLPRRRLRAYGFSSADLRPPPPDDYPFLLEELMAEAETYFEEGMAGIALLPWRMRVGIRAAARMYREILNEVRAAGYDNLGRRAVVPWWRKGAVVLRDGYGRRRAQLRPARPAHPVAA